MPPKVSIYCTDHKTTIARLTQSVTQMASWKSSRGLYLSQPRPGSDSVHESRFLQAIQLYTCPESSKHTLGLYVNLYVLSY